MSSDSSQILCRCLLLSRNRRCANCRWHRVISHRKPAISSPFMFILPLGRISYRPKPDATTMKLMPAVPPIDRTVGEATWPITLIFRSLAVSHNRDMPPGHTAKARNLDDLGIFLAESGHHSCEGCPILVAVPDQWKLLGRTSRQI